MTRITRSILALLAIMLFVSVPAKASTSVAGVKAIPAKAEISRFPILPGVLTNAQMAKYDLRPMMLDSAWTGLNWYRNVRGGRFVYETLPKGTIVLVDKDGVIRYKADCGNRLIDVTKCPECMGLTRASFGPLGPDSVRFGPSGAPLVGSPAKTPGSNEKGALARLADSMWSAAGAVWSGLGDVAKVGFGLLALLLGLLLLPLLAYLAYRVLQNRGGGAGAAAPAPAPVPAPAARPVAPAPVRAPRVNPIPVVPLGARRREAVPMVRPMGAAAPAAEMRPEVRPEGIDREPAIDVAPAPAADQAEAPVGRARQFVRFVPGTEDEPHMLHFSGMDHVHHEMNEDGSHTLRYWEQ